MYVCTGGTYVLYMWLTYVVPEFTKDQSAKFWYVIPYYFFTIAIYYRY